MLEFQILYRDLAKYVQVENFSTSGKQKLWNKYFECVLIRLKTTNNKFNQIINDYEKQLLY